MKKLSLRLRLTILSSILIAFSCIILTLSLNISADKIIFYGDETPAIELTPSFSVNDTHNMQSEFRLESLYAMILMIVLGSATTYVVVGRAVKPVKTLTEFAKNKNVNTLSEKIPLPKTQDEIYELTTVFNEMSNNLEQSFSLQKRFSADVAHELRTPIASMQSKIEVHKLEFGDEYSNELLKQTERLSKLINDLLWFSEETPLKEVSKVNITQLCFDMVYELLDFAKEKNIEIEIQNTNFELSANDALIERVIYNLLENAIKYNSDTKVGIKFDTKGRSIEIWDNGIGISDEDKKLIFEPFYRVDKSRNRKIGGSGLGLAICKKIIEKHNGKITCKDNAPSGTVFEIIFN